jgi:hypothetical protein
MNVQMPDTFAQWYRDQAEGASPNEALGRHMKRELMHALWHRMLDDEFLHAHEHGILVTFSDGVNTASIYSSESHTTQHTKCMRKSYR